MPISRRAARVRRQGDHRLRRRRRRHGVRGYVSCYDARDRQAALAFRAPCPAIPRSTDDETTKLAAKTWHGESVEEGQRRHRLERVHLRSRAQALLHRHGAMAIRTTSDAAAPAAATICSSPRSSRSMRRRGNIIWHYQINPGEQGTTRPPRISRWPPFRSTASRARC